MRPSEKRQFDRGVVVGIATACSSIQHACADPVGCADVLAAANLDRKKLRAAGVSDHDLKMLEPAFRELAKRKRRASIANQGAAQR